jgi:microcystin-dependent protein
MALETATYIDGLNASNPAASDAISTADDHLRLIKSAIKATFPNISGPVTRTQAQLNNALDKTGDTMTGPLTLSGAPSTDLQAATKAYVDSAVAGGVPSGAIVMWSGSIASIPAGWFLCNGSNGTPDLRDRFIVGAGTSYAVGATGGSANAVVVSHTHTASSSVSDPGHSHNATVNWNGAAGAAFSAFGATSAPNSATATTNSNTTGISVSTTVNSTGSSGTNANLPPYYALAYIMKA